uniref:Sensory/regulatory protein RpfC n=1 Tax=Magnetococcus massalia (strain MO-1) TaxID=451514 RepID=A0A1S7LIK0_MAGMO|nr:putative Histidine kinase with Extracellular solute-binding domain and response regulator receiver domain [Candidatus Magnetococcus massalia]
MNRLVALTLLLLLLGLYAPEHGETADKPAAEPTITIVSAEYPLFFFLNPQGQPSGAIVDYWRLWSQRTGQAVAFKRLSWQASVDAVRQGEADVIAGIFHTPERERYFDFSLPITDLSTNLFYRPDVGPIDQMADLEGLRIGFVADEHSSLLLKDQAAQTIEIPFSNYTEMVKGALAGEIDAFSMEQPVAINLINQLQGLGKIKVAPTPLSLSPMRAAVQENNRALLEQINRGIAQINQGEVRAIMTRWLGQDSHPLRILTAHIPSITYRKEGQLTGLGIEVVQELIARMGRHDTVEMMLWSDAIETVKQQPNTALLPPSRTSKREKLFKWVGPIIPERLYLFKKKGTTVAATTLAEAKKYRVGAVKGYASQRLLKKLGFTHLSSFSSPQEGLKALLAGKIDLWINSNITMAHTAQQAGLDASLLEMVISIKDLPAYLAFNLTTPDPIITLWQTALDEMKHDGAFDEIVARWVPQAGSESGLSSQERAKGSLTAEEQAWLQRHGTIRVGTSPGCAPFSIMNPQQQHEGISADLLARIAKRFDLTIQLIAYPACSELLTALIQQQIDLAPALPMVEKFSSQVRYTRPFQHAPIVVVSRLNSAFLESIQGLENQSVGVVEHAPFLPALVESLPKLKLQRFPTTGAALQAVSRGELDAFVGNLSKTAYWIHQQGLLNLKIAARTPYPEIPIAMAVNRQQPLLADILDRGLRLIPEQERAAIQRHWTSLRFERQANLADLWRKGAWIITAVLLTLLLVLAWNRSLQREIQRREEIERDLVEAKEAAEIANQAKSNFLATMSHEIRTPMNAILGASEILQETSLSQEQKHYIEMFASAGESLLQIINDVLDISKIEAGSMELEQITFSPYKVINDAQRIIQHRAREKGLLLLSHIDHTLPHQLLGDPTRLRQILINFLGNAVKFTDQGSISILLQGRMLSDRQMELTLTVVDTGIGIDAEKQAMIFHAFSQADSSITRRYGGSGLGLTISQRLAALMGGRISLKSRDGHGSSFSLHVPMSIPHPHREGDEPLPFSGRTIFVKHDHPIRHSYIEETLSQLGAKTISRDQQHPLQSDLLTLQREQQQLPDLLLIHHDNDDALNLVSEIALTRAEPELQRIPILICGDFASEQYAHRLKPLHVDYMLNPYDLDSFEQSVRYALDRAVVSQQQAHQEQPQQRQILAVDDSEDNLQLIRAFLKGSPFQVTVAHNGHEAVQLVTHTDHTFDLILMDVQMPGMDGYSATRMIREWEQRHTRLPIPILALTAHAMSDHISMSKEAGCNDHVTKPIKKRTLLELLTTHCPVEESSPDIS